MNASADDTTQLYLQNSAPAQVGETDVVILVCQHARSRLIGHWSLDGVLESNAQLRHARVSRDDGYVVPSSDQGQQDELFGLRGWCVEIVE